MGKNVWSVKKVLQDSKTLLSVVYAMVTGSTTSIKIIAHATNSPIN